MFEIKHLKTLSTLATTGSIRKTADKLFISQSALSHQLKDLEQRLNTPLFIRNTAPVQFTRHGDILLTLANDILPKISSALTELKGNKKKASQVTIAIACHACFQWLLPVTKQFSQQYPNVKIEFLEQLFTFLHNEESTANIDLLFTDEKMENDGFCYHKLGTFEVVAVLANHAADQEGNHAYEDPTSLINKVFLDANDFSKQVLLTYPVKAEQLDIFKLFLNRKTSKTGTYDYSKNHSITIKQVANSHMILQMVAANMGIATLPDWLINSLNKHALVITKPIGEKGIYKTLFARYKSDSPQADIIEKLIPKTVTAFEQLYKI